MTIQLRTVCPGCGEFTATKRVPMLARYDANARKGHLITLCRPAGSIGIYCPVQDT